MRGCCDRRRNGSITTTGEWCRRVSRGYRSLERVREGSAEGGEG